MDKDTRLRCLDTDLVGVSTFYDSKLTSYMYILRPPKVHCTGYN